MDPADRIVVAQAAGLAALLWPGRARWQLPRPVATAAVTACLAGAAVAVAGALPHGSRLTPRVAPPQDAAMLDTGLYAVSRNPIYAGLLVGSAGLAVLRRRPEPLLAHAALVAVLTVKTRREEVHLLERFGAAYADYRNRTPRFVGLVRRGRHEDPRA